MGRRFHAARIAVLFLLAAWASPVIANPPQAAPPTGYLTKTIVVSGKTYRYVVYVPIYYTPDRAWPTILFLHGIGSRGHDGLQQVWDALGGAIMRDSAHWPFLVIFPQCPDGKVWDSQEAVLLAEIAEVKQTYRVDEDRTYLTGLSLGGMGTWYMGAKHPDLFAALVPIAGNGDPKSAGPLNNMPIWAFHGRKDNVVPMAGDQAMVDAAKAAGADITFTIYPDMGHDIWNKVYGDEKLYDWLLAHKRNKR